MNSTLSQNITTAATKSPLVLAVYEVAEIINGLIIILGFITNSLIILILARKRIGSQTTRIILIFLAVSDLTVMIIETFVHFIPYYTKWFRIFHTNLGCGIAFTFQASMITTSSWYIMLMTVERFTVVWFPMRAKMICTQRKVLVACITVPIISFLCYCYFIADFGLRELPGGYIYCGPFKSVEGKAFKTKILLWIVLYFYLPAVFIVVCNSTIVYKLAQASRAQKMIRTSSQKNNSTKNQSLFKRLSRGDSSKGAANSIRKATTLVIAASVAFVVMMIPRGVSVTLSLDASWDYHLPSYDIADAITYLLQYLNHASNFFIYILANNAFRKELVRSFCCWRRESVQRQSSIATHTTYVMKQLDRTTSQTSYNTISPPPSPKPVLQPLNEVHGNDI